MVLNHQECIWGVQATLREANGHGSVMVRKEATQASSVRLTFWAFNINFLCISVYSRKVARAT